MADETPRKFEPFKQKYINVTIKSNQVCFKSMIKPDYKKTHKSLLRAWEKMKFD